MDELVRALLAETERWERLAAEEANAAERHRANGGNNKLADNLSGRRSARMAAAAAVRRIIAEHAAAHSPEGPRST